MLDIEQKIKASEHGLILTWRQLLSLSEGLIETIDCVIVGCKDERLIPKYEPGGDLYTPSEIVLEGIDSSVWQVYAKDETLLKRVQESFKDVSLIPML